MRIYIHNEGLARFATEPYVAPKTSNLDNMFMHLTNYAINKFSGAFKQNEGCKQKDSEEEGTEEESGEEESGHKRSLNAILKILYEQGADADRVMDEIKDIIVKTMIVGQPYMSHIYRSC
jgi:tubulin polyglutamylase TTLL6/13